jgi:hypothetical protein
MVFQVNLHIFQKYLYTTAISSTGFLACLDWKGVKVSLLPAFVSVKVVSNGSHNHRSQKLASGATDKTSLCNLLKYKKTLFYRKGRFETDER